MAAVKEFSVQERLVSICKLQRIDSKIGEIKKLRGELPMEVKDLEDEIEGYNTRIASLNKEVQAIDDSINEKQNIQAESKELLKKYEKQQNNVKNSREFEAINKEIELNELEIKACDKKIKDANIEKEEYIAQRIFPDATTRNWNAYSDKVKFEKGVNVMEAFTLLPDPQTNGGLLVSVKEESLEEVKSILGESIVPIGKMIAATEKRVWVK